ncbi:MAG TPA: bifunctional DNA primase/helicase, partial [Cyanobacteria bacterium UBA8553]|nr:bifunctional DNA primase/helicase [Cyanobacteria bacterium UBA8553]
GSGIHPDLISLNYIHLEGDVPYSYLFISPDVPRKNAGRVREGFLKQYRHVEAGGWWVSGLDPQNNWEPMEWGRFKSAAPRFNYDKQKGQQTEKLVKYESPPKTPNRVTYHRMSLGLWQLVSQRYNVPMPDNIIACDDGHAIGFW